MGPRQKVNLNQGSLFYLAFLGASASLVKIRTEECKPRADYKHPLQTSQQALRAGGGGREGGREGESEINQYRTGRENFPSFLEQTLVATTHTLLFLDL